MDEFTKQKFDQFSRDLGKNLDGLDSNERNALFEQFAAYYVLRRWHVRHFKPGMVPAITIGGVYDQQLDGVAILINGRVITCEEDIEPAITAEEDLTLRFIFLQSTTSNKFDRAKMNTFSIGVVNFWQNSEYDPANDDLIKARNLKDKVYEAFQEEGNGRLHFHLYYICLGNWRTESDFDDGSLQTGADGQPISSLAGLTNKKKRGWRGWTEDYIGSQLPTNPVCAEIVDAKRLREWIDWVVAKDELTDEEPQTDYGRTIHAPQLMPMPTTKLAATGFIGCLSAKELINLLEREDGQGMMEHVFHENVRGFKESSEVNQEIAETLNSPERDQFLLRNNGVTIVCEQALMRDPATGELDLRNYQIVNGLQTSYVIYQHRAKVQQRDEVYVPVKIVVTDNLELKDAIIESTNRQTVIKPVEYLVRRPIVRRLEHFFTDMRQQRDVPPLWLERRQGQFLESDEIPSPHLIISLQELMLAYTAAFLEEPHEAEKGITAVIRKVPKRILGEEDPLAPYFYSAWILHVVRDWVRRKKAREMEPVEYHLVYGLRLMAEPSPLPKNDATAEQRDAYLFQLGEILSSQRKIDPLLARVSRFLQKIIDGASKRTNVATSAKTRNDLRRRIEASRKSNWS